MISLQGKTILVVDDEEGYREVLGDEFAMAGATVLTAANGTEALAIVRRQHIDAVVTDVRMPGGSGTELLDAAKNLNPHTPVVMLITGFADLSAEDAYDKGADAIFSKPCDLEELKAAIHHALLPPEARWGRRVECIPGEFSVTLESDSFAGALQARVLNVGRGGMFVVLEGRFPSIGSRVAFRFGAASGKAVYDGAGICRWARASGEPGLHPEKGRLIREKHQAPLLRSLSGLPLHQRGVRGIHALDPLWN